MAHLLNRNPAARIECLHALIKFIYNKFGSYNSFTMSSIKFNRYDDNIHNYCTLLIDSPLGTKYCPYKENPLDDAGCSLTNGVNDDTTKSKEVSNTINALHALGFVERNGRNIKITAKGIKFSKTNYGTPEMQEIIKMAVLNYGPIIGVLKQICDTVYSNNIFSTNDITVGYPNTSEIVKFKNYNVSLSSGSQGDSNTRTRSCLFAWLTTAGFIRPVELPALQDNEQAHYSYRDFINRSHRGNNQYILVEKPSFAEGQGSFITNMPLNYSNLTKLTAALRENNQAIVREATMQYESRINNRRFAILFFLNQAFYSKKLLLLDNLLTFFHLHYDLFIVSDVDLKEVITSELEIAYMAGIPYDIYTENGLAYIKPITGLNISELSNGAPIDLLYILKNTTL